MVHAPGPGGFVGRYDAINGVEQLIVHSGAVSALKVPFRQVFQLDVQNAGLDGVQTAVIAFHFVMVFLALAVIAQHADMSGDVFGVRDHGAGFPAGAQVFSRIEAECRGNAHGAGFFPAVQFLGKVFRAMGLAGVFDDVQPILGGNLQDGIHVRHLAVKMHRHDGRDDAPAAAVDGPAGLIIPDTFGFQIMAELLGIHVVGLRIHVHKGGNGAALGNGFGGGDKGVGYRDHHLIGLDPGSHQGKAQGVRAAADADAVSGIAESGEIVFEFLHHGPADEAARADGGLKDGRQFLLPVPGEALSDPRKG